MYTRIEIAIILLRTAREEIEEVVQTIKHFNLFDDEAYLDFAKTQIIGKYK